jgi:hypothetical protein
MNKRLARKVAEFRAGLIIESALANGWAPEDLEEHHGAGGLEMIQDALAELAGELRDAGETGRND